MQSITRLLLGGLLLLPCWVSAQITVDVNLDTRHTVGGVDSFDRSVFIQLHADPTEQEWGGWNFPAGDNLRDTFLNGLDVYMGRNTGLISWQLNQMNEDPNRPGYADPAHIAQRGATHKNNYAAQTSIHPYQARHNLVLAAQQNRFFPDGTLTGQGWAFANGHATGEYMGRFIQEFHGGIGQPKPKYIEVMNEPLWDLVTLSGDHEPLEIFEFHNDVAEEIRKYDSTAVIGGYTTAFPNLEEGNFSRWHNRWKLFMDVSGANMDFWSIHLYDFPVFGGKAIYRKGSNMEATLDMMEHYSMLSFQEAKPFIVSEYGAQLHDLSKQPWTPYRDWVFMKSANSQLLSFMDRPDRMLSVIPFILPKGEWGRHANGQPYEYRIMRQAFEGPGESGNYWVYTDMVKFYQLWSDVKGLRIDSRSTDADIQTDAFVNGDKMYLIINNLYFDSTTVDLNLQGLDQNMVQNIRVKHLHLSGNAPVITETNHASLDSVMLQSESTMILEYTFQQPVSVPETSSEVKYYATDYLKPIVAGSTITFQINDVVLDQQGEAVLRLGMGRDHGTSLKPTIRVNGKLIHVPDNYMGYNQLSRLTWFGVKDIPVPYALLREDNTITIQFPDNGGHVSSVTMQVYNFTESPDRTDRVAVTGVMMLPDTKLMEPTTTYPLLAEVLPTAATDHRLTWESTDTSVVKVDEFGMLTADAIGTAWVIATTVEGGFSDSTWVEVMNSVPAVQISSFAVIPDSFLLNAGQYFQLNVDISPIDASNQDVTWYSTDSTIATVDSNGMVYGKKSGMAMLVGTTVDGGLMDTCHLEVYAQYSNTLGCLLLPLNVVSDTTYQLKVDYTAGEEYDLAIELADANNNWVGEGRVTVQPGIGTAEIELNCVSTVNWTDPVFPTPGPDYTWKAWIRDVGGDWSTNKGGCQRSNVTISEATSIERPELAGVKLYPNPVNHLMNIDMTEPFQQGLVSFLDLTGALVKTQVLQPGSNQVQVMDLPAGYYIVRVETEQGAFTRTIAVSQ
ncbi:Ig-like domain-containing protein [Pontibacter sp. G13]|uniref:Ig-like domain-containing protein n=1 Tax=Pontibacter sp. G13 TaxID=3074898 RepID=UPI00288ACF47|nr:Ig-like domain-containing protein [Pontibacter sp. G13]WNJ19080.1 Ig-like domain-containing protein [Pontibacter sp. G13]